MNNKNNEWFALHSLCEYKIDEEISDKLTDYYCKWILQKEKNIVNMNFKLSDNIENTNWSIKFNDICHILTNINNNYEQYTLTFVY